MLQRCVLIHQQFIVSRLVLCEYFPSIIQIWLKRRAKLTVPSCLFCSCELVLDWVRRAQKDQLLLRDFKITYSVGFADSD